MHPDQVRAVRLARARGGVPAGGARGRVPVFGICLGAQMLARAAGAKVGPADAPEIGWLDIDLTASGRDRCRTRRPPAASTVFQWHHYTFGISDDGEELARSEVCPQAFRLAQPAWGIQFHAEVTLPMIEAWVDRGSRRSADARRGARRRRAHIDRSTDRAELATPTASALLLRACAKRPAAG